jgi:hypothetical protein
MGLDYGMAFRLPGGTRLRDGLGGAGFIFIELPDPSRFCSLARELTPSFFSNVSRSETNTVPLVRVRRAEPVRHQVRVCWKL